MTDTTRSAHEKRVERQSREAFARHEIVEHSTHRHMGRWLMCAPDEKHGGYTGIFWVEVVELEHGHLLVHGDIPPVVFCMYPTKGAVPGSLVRWMRRPTPRDGYLQEKAGIGAGAGREVCRKYKPEIAVEDARAWWREEGRDDALLNSDGGEDEVGEFEEKFRDALGRIGRDDCLPQEAASLWFEVIEDCEVWQHWGYVTDVHFAHTWAALQRLNELLDKDPARLVADQRVRAMRALLPAIDRGEVSEGQLVALVGDRLWLRRLIDEARRLEESG